MQKRSAIVGDNFGGRFRGMLAAGFFSLEPAGALLGPGVRPGDLGPGLAFTFGDALSGAKVHGGHLAGRELGWNTV